jgi:cation-transporting ATPase E
MKDADCAIAMASGAQAASQVAQLVLLESDFAAIPHIVGEGRRVINNIQRAASLFLVKNIFALGTTLISFLSPLSYPMEPLHMSIISGLTIGVPSFFLSMEPNYQRVQGRFLPRVLRKAFPGGVTNIFVILAAQIAVAAVGLSAEDMSTVSTAILAAVGMLVLYQVCKPFVKFRRMVWFAMLSALVLCFTVLGSFLELRTGDPRALVIMGGIMLAAPLVLFVTQKAFDLGESLWKQGKK